MKEILNINKILDQEGELDTSALLEIVSKLDEKISNNIFSNFEGIKFTAVITDAVTNQSISHGLNIVPNCVIIVKKKPDTASITFSYDTFTDKSIIVTTNMAVTCDIILGRLDE